MKTKCKTNRFAFLCALCTVLLLSGCASFFASKRKKTEQQEQPKQTVYEKTLGMNRERVGSDGLFGVLLKGDKLYFDIPLSLLGRDMLVVNRIESVPASLNEAGINKGINYQNTLIRLEKENDGKHLLIRNVRPQPLSPEEDAITQSVVANYVDPLMGKLKVADYSSDSTRVLVEVSEYYNGSSTLLNNLFSLISIGGSATGSLSKIVSAKAYKQNITVVSDLSTSVTEGKDKAYLTVRTSSSILLLPEHPQRGRRLHRRVGYFTVSQSYYADNQSTVEHSELITRWHLTPRDTAAYLRGELVEPVHPILFYIDDATPRQWRRYIKEGVEQWQKAFERAGFKNAIVAQEISGKVDRGDLTVSSINYIASEMKNAMGPSLFDPRNGEIVQADIIWWHNVLDMLRNWIVLQTGATRKGADSWALPEALLGDAMRFVACHEVGHSLGLRHNMIASSAYSIAQLRDPAFTREHGTSPSIMDYARYNYVAQPGDGVEHFSPQIGAYDIFAIEYGYRWYPTEESERKGLQQILDSHKGAEYAYSEVQDGRDALDPRAQTEDLSDNPVEASTLGIANLKRLMPRLRSISASGDKDGSYRRMGQLYNALLGQWDLLLHHPMALVGGVYIEKTSRGEKEQPLTFVPKEQQREAVRFLLREGVRNTDWLFANPDVLDYTLAIRQSPAGDIEQVPSLMLKNAQGYLFWDLLDEHRLVRMSENEARNGNKAFGTMELMGMLYDEVFGNNGTAPLTVKQRFEQKGLVDALILGASGEKATKSGRGIATDMTLPCLATDHSASAVIRNINMYGSLADRISDAISVKRSLLHRIRQACEVRSRTATTAIDRAHYTDIKMRIDFALAK